MWSWTFFDDFWENEKPLKPNSFNGFRGRSEETRTPDILVPNQTRYQLRYTPIEELCLQSIDIITNNHLNVNSKFENF